MAQIFFFTGANRYALLQERRRWTQQFRERHGDENLSFLDGPSLGLRALIDEVSAFPFIGGKRLVVVDGLPKFKKGEMDAVIEALHPETVLLLTSIREQGKGKETLFEKEVRSIAEVKEFPALQPRALLGWMRDLATECGSNIDETASQELRVLVGDDQTSLEQELRKLACFASGRSITVADVRLLSVCRAEREVWRLLDLLGQRRQTAFAEARDLLNRGFSPQALWSMMLWMLTSAVGVAASVEQGARDPWAIARDRKLGIGAVKSAIGVVRGRSQKDLFRSVDLALCSDRGLKTGQYRATTDATEEQLALIDRVMLSLAD